MPLIKKANRQFVSGDKGPYGPSSEINLSVFFFIRYVAQINEHVGDQRARRFLGKMLAGLIYRIIFSFPAFDDGHCRLDKRFGQRFSWRLVTVNKV